MYQLCSVHDLQWFAACFPACLAAGVFAHLGLEASSKMHGGPPMVLLDPQTLAGAAATAGDTFSSSSEAFYLGVVHYWEPAEGSDNKDGRVYHHYLIMTEARPPFSIIKVNQACVFWVSQDHAQHEAVSGDAAMLG